MDVLYPIEEISSVLEYQHRYLVLSNDLIVLYSRNNDENIYIIDLKDQQYVKTIKNIEDNRPTVAYLFETVDNKLCYTLYTDTLTKVKIVDYINNDTNNKSIVFDGKVIGQLSNYNFVSVDVMYQSISIYDENLETRLFYFTEYYSFNTQVINDNIFIPRIGPDITLVVLNNELEIKGGIKFCDRFSKAKNDVIMIILAKNNTYIRYLYNKKIINIINPDEIPRYLSSLIELNDGRILLKGLEKEEPIIMDNNKFVYKLSSEYVHKDYSEPSQLSDGRIIQFLDKALAIWELPIVSLFHRKDLSKLWQL